MRRRRRIALPKHYEAKNPHRCHWVHFCVGLLLGMEPALEWIVSPVRIRWKELIFHFFSSETVLEQTKRLSVEEAAELGMGACVYFSQCWGPPGADLLGLCVCCQFCELLWALVLLCVEGLVSRYQFCWTMSIYFDSSFKLVWLLLAFCSS